MRISPEKLDGTVSTSSGTESLSWSTAQCAERTGVAVSVTDVDVDVAELINQLVPSLHVGAIGGRQEAATYGETLVEECQRGLSAVLPFKDAERAFLDLLLEQGKIDATF